MKLLTEWFNTKQTPWPLWQPSVPEQVPNRYQVPTYYQNLIKLHETLMSKLSRCTSVHLETRVPAVLQC